ncbi:hypothetical protein TWF106_005558 [Orbilia oligospora]|uniref:Uncharacterized protein n=1 Tax=Orbilia oligospora TaxID=2813651 RepID=A0A6G1M2V8_ORBOL|nr:hypothetical protein TWF106_005558 [Orbilia oligospora]KAF3242409.1 hypothetical protein TWF192_008665 [Orbilia oligospora]
MEASESVHTVTVANTNDHIDLQIGIDGFSFTASKCKPQKITGNSGHRSSLESCFGNRTKRYALVPGSLASFAWLHLIPSRERGGVGPAATSTFQAKFNLNFNIYDTYLDVR